MKKKNCKNKFLRLILIKDDGNLIWFLKSGTMQLLKVISNLIFQSKI